VASCLELELHHLEEDLVSSRFNGLTARVPDDGTLSHIHATIRPEPVKTVWLIPPFVTSHAGGQDPEASLLTCPVASVRLRMAVAALEWRRCGHENVFWNPEDTSAGDPERLAARILVVPKFYDEFPLQPWLEACRSAKREGRRLVVDISDNPFSKTAPVQAFYSEVLKVCDAIVVNSERMAELMAPHAAHPPLVIEDAIFGAMGRPAFMPAARVELLWFGHPSNLRYLRGCLDALIAFATKRRCRLTVLTMEGYGVERLAQEIQIRFAPTFEARFIPWSLETMKSALRKCDLVLLPSDPADPHKAGASANRIAESLNAGRFPIASPLRSHLQFSDAAWLGADMVEGIRWALENRGEAMTRMRRGQARVAERFATTVVGRQWRELLESLCPTA
jgi:glycosyltransferase involved in cell wall biosynthesis